VKKLLIIENDRDTLDVIGVILEDNGFEVVESQKKISLQEIERINADVIVIDHLLDDGLGSDLCLEIKSNPATKNAPVILYSASYKIEQLAKDNGADAFIAKPFDLDSFLEIVNELALQ
jgi:DNA-binding response OmpR family regulator